jgi:protein-L-isoaspartate(D-aspartate) O-methyltransferase
MTALDEQRRQLVEQLAARGIGDPLVLGAMRSVRREAFLPPYMAPMAYLDKALPIDQGQSISQPYVVALMAEALRLGPHDRVLEVGAGSGYAAAVLGSIAREVITIERHAELAIAAARRLAAEGFTNVAVIHGDGTLGWPPLAPYDAIVVAACGREAPRPLLDQLKVGGRLVLPIGDEDESQTLVRMTRLGEHEYRSDELGDVRFVPLVGKNA